MNSLNRASSATDGEPFDGPSAVDGPTLINRLFPVLGSYVLPLSVFGGGFLCVATVSYLLLSPSGQWFATQFAWRIGPWKRIPIPFDSSVFDFPAGDLGLSWIDWVPNAAVGLFLVSLILTILHAGLFAAILWVYSHFGWPPYVQDVRERLNRKALWRACVRRSWWILPVFILVHQLWRWVELGQSYAQCGSIIADWPFTLGILILAILTHVRIATQTIVTAVVKELRPDERRCHQCAYLLRGLTNPVCPECGEAFPQTHVPRFSLIRRNFPRYRSALRTAWWLVALAVISAPAWEPIAFEALPKSASSLLPGAFVPPWRWGHISVVPLRLETFGILRRSNEVMVITARERKGQPREFRWWYWSDWKDWEKEFSTLRIDRIDPYLGRAIPIGNDDLGITITWTSWQNTWWGWLSASESGWQVEVLTLEQAPMGLKALALDAETDKSPH